MQLSGTATLSVSSCSNLGVIPSGPRAELDFSVLIISLPQRSRNLPRSIWILWVVALADCPGFWLGKRIRSNQLELQPFHHYLSQSCHLHWEAPLLSWCWSCSWCMCRISFCHWCWQLNPAPQLFLPCGFLSELVFLLHNTDPCSPVLGCSCTWPRFVVF